MNYAFKRLLIIIGSLLSIEVSAQIPSSGLVAHWPFSGNANDISGNGHHGNINTATFTSGASGLSNTALLFNNVNSCVGIPYSSSFNMSALSMCAVFKTTAFYGGPCQGNFILSRGTQGFNGSLILDYFDNAYNSCSVSDTNYYVFAGQVGPTVLPATTMQNATRVHTNNWYCFVLTFDGTTGKLYVNGTLINSFTGWSAMGSSTDSICIGKYPWGGASYPYNFIGAIDDIAIYNRALTATEVGDYCNAILVPDTLVYISQPLSKTAFCPGDTVHVNYNLTYNFNPGNVFTAELSNGSGSFASPVAIGTLTSSVPGKIICTIPAGTPAGTGYRIRVRSSNPVRTSADNGVNLAVNPKPTPVLTNNSPVCAGDTIKLAATYGGATFNWFGPGAYTNTGGSVIRPNATISMSGTYTVVSTANGCADTTNLNVVVVTKPTPLLTNNSPVCSGDSIKLSASYGSATFTWSGPGGYNYTGANVIRPNATSSMAGTYAIVTMLGACRDTSNLTVVVDPTPVVNITGKVNICDGDSLHLKSTSTPAASSYSWNWPGGTSVQQNIDIANAVAGTYVLNAANGNCAGKDSVNVQVTKMNVDLGKDQNLCNVALPVLSPGIAGAGYLWQDGSTGSTFAVPGSGKYYVTVTFNGCIRSDTVNIKAIYAGVDIGNDTALCLGKTLTLKAPDGYDSYGWNTGDKGKSITVKEAGRYWVRVLKEYCDAFDTVDVTYLDGRFYLPEDTVLCNGQVYELEVNSIDGSKYEWKNGSTGNTYTINQPGYYWVNAINQCGSFGDTMWVEYEECECRPFMPTAFTPNGDGRNDAIHPYLHCPAKEYKFMIVNRWGQIVFESKNPNDRWDGNFKNTPAEAGTYFYYLEVKGPDGRIYRMKGDITLVH